MNKKLLGILLMLFLALTSSIAFAESTGPTIKITRILDDTCGVPWGASQQTAKEVMSKSPFEATLQIEDSEILVYSGTFAGIPSEFSFSFINNKLAVGMIFIYDNPASSGLFNTLKNILIDKYGEPAVSKSINSRPESTWIFASSYKPLPNYSYIKLFPAKGSLLGQERKNRSVVVMMSADHELEDQYYKARAVSKTN